MDIDLSGILAAPSDAEFQRELREVVAFDAPRAFALCEEEGVREDGYVRYWGLAFDDCAEVISTVDDARVRFRSVEAACARLGRRRKMHLIWVETAVASAGDGAR